MVSSKTTTVNGYLSELPADRTRDIARVRAAIRETCPRVQGDDAVSA